MYMLIIFVLVGRLTRLHLHHPYLRQRDSHLNLVVLEVFRDHKYHSYMAMCPGSLPHNLPFPGSNIVSKKVKVNLDSTN
jgi:hypothetical protein